jgi:hypothetical protein
LVWGKGPGASGSFLFEVEIKKPPVVGGFFFAESGKSIYPEVRRGP